jgi:hypothetical protein
MKKILSILLILSSICLAPRAFAQYSGAYVNPRPFVLYTGSLTNSQVIANAFTLTNLLNYSGFHRVGLWLTINPGTNNANRNSNLWINVSASFGSGGGYTNSALGTNIMYTTTPVVTWTNVYNQSNTIVAFTNLDWPVADSVLYLQGTIGTSSTNNDLGTPAGAAVQIDGVVTP